ncbi:MAG: type II/IV secretion system protein [Ruminococcaceae bacterium]|nr:type II/IV secretion system protein [Oscillospiraceae bacterium]MBQ7302207.1 type II/IV secretion system protein [Clostridia bacterium]
MTLDFEILQFFAYKKIIKKKQINEILSECQRLDVPAEKYLLAQGICNEITALAAMGELFCLPYIEMDMLEVDEELLDCFNLPFLRRQKFVPVFVDKNGTMVVAVGRPLDFIALSAIATVHSGALNFILVPSVQIDIYLDSLMAVKSTAVALDNLQREKDKRLIDRANTSNDVQVESEADVINAPAVKLVDSIIKETIPFRASDIHIEPHEKSVFVRYRIDGDLSDRAEFPIESYPAIAARIKILSGINIAERRIPQDGRINMMINGTEYDFRVSTIPTIHGEKFVIRVLDKSAFNLTRKELGFTDESNAVIEKILAHPHGIVLLTGPTGCGKTTTLYAFLKELNKPEVNIVTVEDPVEYSMSRINQVQINAKANMTFANALRSILRQDPDVIMVGEIRDEETAQIAIRAAITGHLVLSTLHTNDAPGAITRLIDMGATNYLVADAIVGVISQRLVKRLCPACKKKGKTNAREMALLGITEPVSICRPQGCQFCGQTGYRGRVAVHEIMYMNESVRSAVSSGNKTIEQIREVAEANGMVPMWNACREYVIKGITSISELMTLYIE